MGGSGTAGGGNAVGRGSRPPPRLRASARACTAGQGRRRLDRHPAQRFRQSALAASCGRQSERQRTK
eukprot:3147501-Pleurochrysis_carterae.AAC.1